MTATRRPAVAGRFYPDDAASLSRMVRGLLEGAAEAAGTPPGPLPKAIVVPHAGYVFSGPIAASAYARLSGLRETVKRVVLMGPAHFVELAGFAVPASTVFETPLGTVPVDVDTVRALLDLPQVSVLDAAHVREHSLEVHLPFLQTVLADFRLVPLVAGRATAEEAAQVIEQTWDGPETLFVVSSDLSHYHDYETARRLDGETSRVIEELRYADLRGDRACGYVALGGLLWAAQSRGMSVLTVDLRNSGDTSGPRDRVVGYGAYVVG